MSTSIAILNINKPNERRKSGKVQSSVSIMDVQKPQQCVQTIMNTVLKAWELKKDTRYEIISVCDSSAYRIAIYPEEGGTVNLFLKSLADPSNSDLQIYFENEVKFYSYIMPAFTEFIEKWNSNKRITIPVTGIPKCFYGITSDLENILILQDLLSEGYSTKNLSDITVRDLHTIMRSLGQFHAISFAFMNLREDEFTFLIATTRETVFRTGETRMQQSLQEAAERALNCFRENFPEDSIYVRKVGEFIRQIIDRLSKMVQIENSDRRYGVITHGNICISNLYFKDSVYFTGFKQCRFGSPALDILSVLYLLMNKRIHNVHKHSLIHTYYTGLSDTLKIFNLNPHVVFPYTVLKQHIHKYSGFIIGVSLLYLQQNIENFDQDEQNLWKSPNECKLQILENLKEAVENDWLDI